MSGKSAVHNRRGLTSRTLPEAKVVIVPPRAPDSSFRLLSDYSQRSNSASCANNVKAPAHYSFALIDSLTTPASIHSQTPANFSSIIRNPITPRPVQYPHQSTRNASNYPWQLIAFLHPPTLVCDTHPRFTWCTMVCVTVPVITVPVTVPDLRQTGNTELSVDGRGLPFGGYRFR